MAFSKVTLNGDTLMDVTQDTVTPSTLVENETATRNNGEQITGSLVIEDAKTRVPVYGMGKNLLDNWYFVGGGSQLGDGIFPINQRGQTSYTSIVNYTVDRWKTMSTSTIVALSAEGVTSSSVAYSRPVIQQLLESPDVLRGHSVTLSVWLSTGFYFASGFIPSQIPESYDSYVAQISDVADVLVETTGNIYCRMTGAINGSYTVYAIKLELGTEQTLCHNKGTDVAPVWVLNDVPDYEEELIKCQTSTADSNDSCANKSLTENSVYYGRCLTAAATAAKEATIPGVTSYYAGLHIRVRFDYAQEATGTVTLNVNGLGALQLRTFASTTGLVTVGEWRGATVLDIEYQALGDGYWLIVNGPHATTSTYGRTILSSSTSSSDTDKAATPSAVKAAYDLANSRVPLNGMGKNLLDNWYFGHPVNQRGQSSYTGAIYGIDRWANSGSGTINVLSDSVTIASGGLQQWVSDSRIIDGETYTISLFTEYGLKTATGTLSSSASGWQFGTTGGDGGWAAIGQYTSGRYDFRITGEQKNYAAKLELGAEQTLCHNEGTDASPVWVLNDIPNYEDELIKCKTAKDDPSDIYANKVVSSNIPNTNLLKNWYFVGGGTGQGVFPVNSRRLSSYNVIGTNVDGWNCERTTHTITLNNDGITFARTADGAYNPSFYQPTNLQAGTYTISIIYKTNNENFRLMGVYLPVSSSWTLYSFSGTYPATTYFNLQDMNSSKGTAQIGDSIQIQAIKIELGTQQTLAHQENGNWVLNEYPDYEEELLRCETSFDNPTDIYANKNIATNVSNRNLIRNWYFASQPFPINSRGVTSLTAAGYFIDGWRIPGGPDRITASLETGSLRLTRGSSSSGGTLLMKLPQAYSGALTISALVKANISTTGTGGIRMRDNDNNSYAQRTATRQGTAVELLYATYDGSANPIATVEIYLTAAVGANDYMDVYAIKLEKGTEQTLAHIENGVWVVNEIPDYQEELIECQTCVAEENDTYSGQVISMNDSHENLVDNWYFVGGGTGPGVLPVNQRQFVSNPSNGQYIIDRWKTGTVTGYTLTVAANGLVTTNDGSGGSAVTIYQYLRNHGMLLGKQVTYSIMTTTGLYTGSTILPTTYNNSGYVINIRDGNSNIIGGVYVTSGDIQARLRSPMGVDVTFVAVKLELGIQQTLAHLEKGSWVLNEIPNYNDELIKCETSVVDVNDTFANQAVSVNVTNRNLLDNWYFMQSQTRGGQLPINTRGLTTVNTGKTYLIDRWAIFDGNGSASISSSGLSITGGTNFLRFGQQIPLWKIEGSQITISVLIGSITSGGTFTIGLGESTGDIINNYGISGIGIITATSAGLYSVTGTPVHNSSGTVNDLANVLFRITQGATVVIKAVKIEYGSQQTLAHLERGNWVLNEIPDYEEERVKCLTNQATYLTDAFAVRNVSIGVPNRNLLDNWYFVGGGSQGGSNKFPINQRGLSEYSANGICIDRWNFTGYSGGTVTLNSDGLTLTKNSATSSPGVQQNFDFDLDNQVITFSLLTSAGVLYTKSIGPLSKSASGWQLSHNFSVFWVGLRYQNTGWNLSFTVANQLSVAAVKLELGTQQTLARNYGGTWVLNEIPNYVEEYNKCRHYLRVFPGTTPLVVRMDWNTATISWIQLEPPMYKTPSVTFTSTAYVGCNGSHSQVASMTSDSPNRIKVTTNGSLTVKSAAALALNGTVTVSAEL